MWSQLVTTLPSENSAVRQRVWRALKSAGAAVLRDGVYLMPHKPDCHETLKEIASEVRAGEGTAWVIRIEEPEDCDFRSLFNRNDEYARVLTDITELLASLSSATSKTVVEQLKQVRKLRKNFTAVTAIDFFPDAARDQTQTALQELETTAARILSPDEPHAESGRIPKLSLSDFQGRLWATRQRPWIDRLASAWLIKRFIDPAAHFLWLQKPDDCPPKAVGFDFDGATFSHVGNRVTFEVLVVSFGLERPALLRLGALVHYLDVGGVQPAEATGVESILAGLRTRFENDDQLLAESINIFDGLYITFGQEVSTT